MNAIPFPEANKVLTAHGCNDLPVFSDGEQCVSCWQPSPEERAAIAAGAPIFLHIFTGHSQPPVALIVPVPEPALASNPDTQAFPA